MKLRAPVSTTACAIVSSVFLISTPADAQVRVARPRPAVRSAVVVRPWTTVFVGGYYYPSIYRTSLWYGAGGFGYYPYGGFGYYPRQYYSPAYYQLGPFGYRYDLSGSVRLQVDPEETEVFVDGYYAGRVDEFDGVFQRLHLEPGEHNLELYLAGHRSFTQRLYLQPGRTFRIRHTMQALGPGDPEPAKPSGAPLPPPGARNPRGPGQGPAPSRVERPAEGFGQLSLRVQPADAEVLIDGERWQGALENERLNVQLGAALHRLEIRKEGYRSYFTDITIRNGETLTLNVALTKQ